MGSLIVSDNKDQKRDRASFTIINYKAHLSQSASL